MINLIFCCTIFSVNIFPQNKFIDRYSIIPPLGQIKSIATSPLYIFVISDNYLLFLNKQDLTIENTIYFDETVNLIGYDQQYDDLWITNNDNIIRLTIASYNKREYPFSKNVNRLGVGIDYVYFDAGGTYSLNKRTGEIKPAGALPENLTWYKKTTEDDIRNFPFLNPYYYTDESMVSQTPFYKFGITSIYDDGMYLYVGTDRFGVLRYHKVSWQKKRIVYGPLDLPIRRVRKFDNQIYFLSPSGISYYPTGKGNWNYLRLSHEVTDIAWLDNNFILSIDNRISRTSGAMTFTISDLKSHIISLSSDEKYFYLGTNSGLFKIIKGAKEPLQFGPDRHPVHVVYPIENDIYVGGEIGFYNYDRETKEWSKIINQGVKDIVKIDEEFYLLSVANQLIKYREFPSDTSASDSGWLLLPYFNIYDIDTDNEVLYCASYSGMYYYEPSTDFYKLVFDLPRIKYDYVFIIEDKILAVSADNIYSLPTKYRD